jgi:putative membrane protein insertion efficiency factor
MRNVVKSLIRLYQVLLSPVLGNNCRFYPSCSHYALQAIDAHGVPRGLWLTLRRLGKCHPWHPGGVDPVPAGCRHQSPEGT